MTDHPHHRYRVLLWSPDPESDRPRISGIGSFVEFSSASAYQAEALRQPDIVRADLMRLMHSIRSDRPAEDQPALVPELESAR
jgi:hypothetical protein